MGAWKYWITESWISSVKELKGLLSPFLIQAQEGIIISGWVIKQLRPENVEIWFYNCR